MRLKLHHINIPFTYLCISFANVCHQKGYVYNNNTNSSHYICKNKVSIFCINVRLRPTRIRFIADLER